MGITLKYPATMERERRTAPGAVLSLIVADKVNQRLFNFQTKTEGIELPASGWLVEWVNVR